MTPLPTTLPTHDFRQPRQLMPTSWRAMQRWHADGCRLISERWWRLGLDVSLTHQQTRVLSVRSALAAIPEPGWGVRGTLGARSIDALLVCTPRLLRSLARRLLGDSPDESTEVVALTAVEESMAELLFSELLQAVGDAWPGAESLDCRLLNTVSQPHRTRMFPPRSSLVVTVLRINAASQQADQGATADGTGSAGSDLLWVMPHEDLEDLLEIECSTPAAQPARPHPAIPQIMREMPISVTVELGRAHLSMSELTALETGDVVILEQSVNRLLNVCVGSAVKFRGRPGRLGSQRCLEIHQVLEEAPVATAALLS